MDFQLIIPKSPDECLKAIKKSIPYYYDMTKDIGTIYSYKFEKDKLLIISCGVGYVPITFKIELIRNNDNETIMVGSFSKNTFSRLIIWIISFILFFVSILTLFGILIGLVSIKESPILTISLPLILLVVSILYFLYSERARKREKKAIINLITNLFSTK